MAYSMHGERNSRYFLRAESGVEIVNGKTVAVSSPVWLRLEANAPLKTKSWVRLRYSSNYFDENIRPLIRLKGAETGPAIQPMNGTLFGVGEWIGYIPEGVTEISISPVRRMGRFDFVIESIEAVSVLHQVAQAAFSRPALLTWAIDAQVRGAREEARRALKFASTSERFSNYAKWQKRLSRPCDLDGVDQPRADWTKTSKIQLFLSVRKEDAPWLPLTIRSLISQAYSRWSLVYVMAPACPDEMRAQLRLEVGNDPRFSEIDGATDLRTIATVEPANIFCAAIKPGDVFPDYSLAVVAESLAHQPLANVLYGDEDAATPPGILYSPILRPDWSPYFNAARSYIGRVVFLRMNNVLRAGPVVAEDFIGGNHDFVKSCLLDCERTAVVHVRRIIFHEARNVIENKPHDIAALVPRSRDSAASAMQYPDVAIVVLSRDNAEFLSECIDGLFKKTDYPHFRVTLVDNGSHKPDALALMRDLRRHPRIDVLDRPGPFNYSALCNEAAGASLAPLLVFLNDDIAMRDPHWLKPLIHWATRPDIGIAGAKLLFPNGRIQHAGVVLGMGGIAAHIFHDKDSRNAGYLENLRFAHEVEAVTAACVAIERKKFDAVGGFDAVNLPVELNDIDLCLRLAERGLSTIWTPESVLIHHESTSRGRSPRKDRIYRAERDYFIERWQDAIRDDRYFHPNLSLFSYTPALA